VNGSPDVCVQQMKPFLCSKLFIFFKVNLYDKLSIRPKIKYLLATNRTNLHEQNGVPASSPLEGYAKRGVALKLSFN